MSKLEANIVITNQNALQYNITNYPEQIKMSNLPLMWQGWNEKFVLTDEICEKCPVYRLHSYILYGLINIIGGKIFKKNGRWIYMRDSELFGRKCNPCQKSLLMSYMNLKI